MNDERPDLDFCLKAEIEQGIADFEAGNVSEGVEVLKRLRKRIT